MRTAEMETAEAESNRYQAMKIAEMETAEAESNRYKAMTPTEAESNWFEALFEEDSLRVMLLLKHHPQLLKVGWEGDDSCEVEGSPENYWHPRVKRKWMGRTALHVGAKRGCVELIKQVLELCNLDVARAYSVLDDEQGAETALPIGEDVVPMAATSESDVASSKRKEAGGNGKNFADSSQNAAASRDAEQTVRLIPEPTVKKSRDGEETKQEATQSMVAHWQSQVEDNKADFSVEGTFAHWKERMSANRKKSNVLKSANSSNPLNASGRAGTALSIGEDVVPMAATSESDVASSKRKEAGGNGKNFAESSQNAAASRDAEEIVPLIPEPAVKKSRAGEVVGTFAHWKQRMSANRKKSNVLKRANSSNPLNASGRAGTDLSIGEDVVPMAATSESDVASSKRKEAGGNGKNFADSSQNVAASRDAEQTVRLIPEPTVKKSRDGEETKQEATQSMVAHWQSQVEDNKADFSVEGTFAHWKERMSANRKKSNVLKSANSSNPLNASGRAGTALSIGEDVVPMAATSESDVASSKRKEAGGNGKNFAESSQNAAASRDAEEIVPLIPEPAVKKSRAGEVVGTFAHWKQRMSANRKKSNVLKRANSSNPLNASGRAGTDLSIGEDVVPMAATSESDVASSKRKEAGGNGKNFADSSQNVAASRDAEQTVRLIPEPTVKKSRDGEETKQEATQSMVAHWQSQVEDNKADFSVEGTFAHWKERMSANRKKSNVLKRANSSNPLNASGRAGTDLSIGEDVVPMAATSESDVASSKRKEAGGNGKNFADSSQNVAASRDAEQTVRLIPEPTVKKSRDGEETKQEATQSMVAHWQSQVEDNKADFSVEGTFAHWKERMSANRKKSNVLKSANSSNPLNASGRAGTALSIGEDVVPMAATSESDVASSKRKEAGGNGKNFAESSQNAAASRDAEEIVPLIPEPAVKKSRAGEVVGTFAHWKQRMSANRKKSNVLKRANSSNPLNASGRAGTDLSIGEDVVPMAATSESDVASSKRKEAGGNGKNFAESSENAAASKDAEEIVPLIPEPAVKSDGEETTRAITANRSKQLTRFASRQKSNLLKSSNSLNAIGTWSRLDLLTLLVSKDGQYELDSLCIAIVQGNKEIVDLLNYAMGEVPDNPFGIEERPRSIEAVEKDKRARLSEATEKVIAQGLNELKFGPTFRTSCLELYSKDRDFNFLPREEYLFHFLYTSHFRDTAPEDLCKTVRDALWTIVVSCKDDLWRFLLELHDGQGRCPFHIQMESGSDYDYDYDVPDFVSPDAESGLTYLEVYTCAMNAPDGTGKSALHRSAGCDDKEVFGRLLTLRYLRRTAMSDLLADWKGQNWQVVWPAARRSPNWLVWSERRNFGFRGEFYRSNPVQTAIMLAAFEWRVVVEMEDEHFGLGLLFGLEQLLSLDDVDLAQKIGRDMCYRLRFSTVQINIFGSKEVQWVNVGFDSMELACLIENYWVVKYLLEDTWNYWHKGYLKKERKFEKTEEKKDEKTVDEDYRNRLNTFLKHPWHPIHITSATGNYEILKLFIDHPQFDPLLQDFEGNTPLHHALNVRDLKFKPHLLDYVSLKHMVAKDFRKVPDDVWVKDRMLERQACINILLQAGCDIFKVNNDGQVPHPQGRWSKNKEFLSWWNDRQLQEFGSIQASMNTASNAIAVTATLVATASYVGPLQPPLSYTLDNGTNQYQYENNWVAMFIFCDTLSFYLAIVAIIFSLVPALPVPQQAMVKELRRKNTMVVLAIFALFPSILCVLLAFVASSMATVSVNITSSIGGKLTISTVCISAPFILAAFFVCLYRLLGILFPRNPWIRYMYKYTPF